MKLVANIFTIVLVSSFPLFSQPVVLSEARSNEVVQFGLPGWIPSGSGAWVYGWVDPADNITGANLVEMEGSLDITQQDFTEIPVPPAFFVSRNGEDFARFWVDVNGNVYLGNHPATPIGFPPNMEGRHVYIVPFGNLATYSQGSGFSWRIVRLGPPPNGTALVLTFDQFVLAESNKRASYQVVIFADGEVQIHYRVADVPQSQMTSCESPFGYWMAPRLWELANFVGMRDDEIWLGPDLEGVKRQFLDTEYNMVAGYRPPTLINLFADGRLRPGWIAKSFQGPNVGVSIDNAGLLRMNFPQAYWPGALIAFDNSREFPSVDGIQCLDIETEGTAVDPYVWFFDETLKTHDANYPKLNRYVASDLAAHCVGFAWQTPNIIPACAFAPSFNRATERGITPGDIRAPALKFQTGNGVSAGEVAIKRVSLWLRQPMSLLLPAPPVLQVSVDNGPGGTSLALGRLPLNQTRIPVRFGRSQSIELVAEAGNNLRDVSINGTRIMHNGRLSSLLAQAAGIVCKAEENGLCRTLEITLPNITTNISITATYSECVRRPEITLPEYIQRISFLDGAAEGSRPGIESYIIPDGFGRTAQTQTKLGDGLYRVNTTYLDGLGRTKKSVKSFVETANSNFKFVEMECEYCIVRAKAWYDGSDGIERPHHEGAPYKEIAYRQNPLGETMMVGGVGGKTSMATSPAKSWVIPLAASHSFATPTELADEGLLDRLASLDPIETRIRNPVKFLTITRDSDGKFTQSIADPDGKVVSVWTNPSQNSSESSIINLLRYDDQGRVIEEVPASQEGLKVVSDLDVHGRIKSVTGPDRGMVTNKYDSKGRLRFTQTAVQARRGANYFTAIVYDNKGRAVEIGEVRGGHLITATDATIPAQAIVIHTRSYYDKVDLGAWQQLTFQGSAALSTLLENQNVRPGDLAAVAAYDHNGSLTIFKAYSYDRFGRQVTEYQFFGSTDMPPVRTYFEYNDANELAYSSFSKWTGTTWEALGVREREYDQRGRLVAMKQDGLVATTTEYTPTGAVRQTNSYTLQNSQTPVLQHSRNINIEGYVQRYSAKQGNTELYSQEMARMGNSGRLSNSIHRWNLPDMPAMSTQRYIYDDMGRLTEAKNHNDQALGNYAYDAVGRFTHKEEPHQAEPHLEEQMVRLTPIYDANSYRIARATGLPGYGTTRDFEYDASGNLVIDRARKLVFLNDNRGLAETIHYYENGVPSTFTAQDAEKHQLPPTTATEVVRMAYDEGGNRIYREILRPGRPPVSQEVTLAGKAVFRRDVGAASWQLKFLMGIDGRYETAGQEFFVMKDHQGSVRAVADATGRIVGADDYLPYGKAKPLHVSSQAGNPPWKWQGKELDADGQYEFYYFGARYWNPDLGIWLTPDPAGQFANPYGYGGDPVNYTDPDGRLAFLAPVLIGAAVGAYAGASIQSNSWNPTNWKGDAWKGAISGAFVGGLAGGFAAQGLAAAGMNMGITAGGKATYGWTLTSSILSGANTNMAIGALSGNSGEQLWMNGLTGALTGAATASGGFGLLKNFGGQNAGVFQKASVRLAYSNAVSVAGSVGNNLASGNDWNSRIRLNLGPVDAVVGKDATLADNLWANAGNIATNTVGFIGGTEHRFDWDNLAFEHSGGVFDGSLGYWGAHAVLGPSKADGLADHEFSHVLQSRSEGVNNFWLGYGTQSLLSLAGGGHPLNQGAGGTNAYENIGYGNYYGF